MVVKKGKVEKNYIWSDGTVENAIEENTVATVIEKTEGNYVEILFRKDSYQRSEYGNIVDIQTTDNFTVYHGKTIEQVLRSNGIIEAVWTEPMVQIS